MSDFNDVKTRLGFLKSAIGKQEPYTAVTLDGKTATASNGILGITVDFDSGITAKVAGKKFIDVVSGCSEMPAMKLTDSNLIIKEGDFRALIPVIQSDLIEQAHDEGGFTWEKTLEPGDSKEFIATLDTVKSAIATDITRTTLNCAALIDGVVYATDGRRMHWRKLKSGMTGAEQILFPRALVDIVTKLESLTWIGCTQKAIHVSTDNGVQIKCAMVEGKFPNVIDVIPEIDPSKLVEITPAMRDAIIKVKKHSDTPGIVFDNDTIGNAGGSVTVKGFKDLPACRLNVDYLADIVGNIDLMKLNSDMTPAYFEDFATDCKYIIMPMRNSD